MAKKQIRTNKSKEQLAAEMRHLEKVNRDKALVKLMFPIVSNQETIYNAQTVLAATAGYIKAEIDKKISEITVADLKIDVSKEKEGLIKSSLSDLLGLIAPEKAKDVSMLLERFANTLAQYSANEFMKKSMKEITIDKIISK